MTITTQARVRRRRTSDEIAAINARVAEIDARKSELWKQQCALWEESKALSREARVLQRRKHTTVLALTDIAVTFDGVFSPTVTPDGLAKTTRAKAVTAAWRKLRGIP